VARTAGQRTVLHAGSGPASQLDRRSGSPEGHICAGRCQLFDQASACGRDDRARPCGWRAVPLGCGRGCSCWRSKNFPGLTLHRLDEGIFRTIGRPGAPGIVEVRNTLLDRTTTPFQLVDCIDHHPCRLINRSSRAIACPARWDDRDASIVATRSGLNKRSVRCSETRRRAVCLGKARVCTLSWLPPCSLRRCRAIHLTILVGPGGELNARRTCPRLLRFVLPHIRRLSSLPSYRRIRARCRCLRPPLQSQAAAEESGSPFADLDNVCSLSDSDLQDRAHLRRIWPLV
jgi:hypothetical protein